jgi:microcystin-dependent protein
LDYYNFMWASITYTFSPSTIAKASEVNQNFSDVVAGLDKAMPSGGIILWANSIATIPVGYYLCDGNNGTPNLVGKFVQGAGSGYAVGLTGGDALSLHSHTLSHSHTMYHSHTFSGTTGQGGTTANAQAGGSSSFQISTHTHDYSGTTAGANNSTTSDASNTTTSGSSNTENRPPFLTLANIMKS